MSIFQRIVLLLKVLVMLSLGTSAAWASTASPQQGFNAPHGHGVIMLAKSESELAAIPNFGSKSIEEVIENLEGRGHHLRQD